MAALSINAALGAGFSLIKRKPLAVLAWGLSYLVLGVLPAVGVLCLMGPDMIALFRQGMLEAASGGHAASSAAMMQLQGRNMMLQPVIMISSLVGRAVLVGAIFRAVLEPERGAFAYLRLGAKEWWLGLLMLATQVLVVFMIIGLVLLNVAVDIGLAAGLASSHLATGWTVLAGVILGAASLLLLIWVWLRWSMAGPMTFAAGEFRLFESWRLTRGHALQLFGLSLLLWLIVVVIGMVIELLVVGAVVGVIGPANLNANAIQIFVHQPPEVWVRTLWPWVAVVAVVGSFVSSALMTIVLAPWAHAYRQLVGEPAPPPAAPADEAHLSHAA